jgi:glucokinase
MPLALGIEIGGTKLQAGVGDGGRELRSLARRPIDPTKGGAGIREAIPGVVEEALKAAGASTSDLRGAGVGFGGPVDGERVLVSHQVEGWQDFPFRGWLQDLLKVPVTLQNDCKAAALAEYTLGAGKGCRRVFYVTVGSGIGGGLVVDGKVDVGQGLGAGEIGHTWVPDLKNGRPEKLELMASGWSIQRRAREAGMTGEPTAQDVHAAAEAGDAKARKVLFETAEFLGLAIGNVITLLCPEKVVLGGGVSLMGPLLWTPLREKTAKYAFKPFAGRWEIVLSALGEPVVVHGAALLGLGAGA